MNSRLATFSYVALQRLRREPVMQALAELRRTEYASFDELASLQARRQIEQFRFAIKHVPYYRRAYREFAAAIENARTRRDASNLAELLPPVSRETVTELYDDFRAGNTVALSTYPDKTSGSSGTPLEFPCDQRAWAYRHALQFRWLQAFGVQLGEPSALFAGLHWDRRLRLNTVSRDFLFNRVRISAYDTEPHRLDAHLRRIYDHRPTYFVGYPSALYDFCIQMYHRGLDLKRLNLKAVFLTAEPVRFHQRAIIEEITGSQCVEFYGSAEGGLTAFQCPEGSLHINSEAVWVDIPDQTTGEILVTDMMLRAFPLIKYRVGDEAVAKFGKCPCGRAHPMLERIEGRSGDPIELPNGRRLNANMPSYIFKQFAALKTIRRYRFVHTVDNRLELQLVVTPAVTEKQLALVEAEVRRAFGEDVPFETKIVESLPHLRNGKHRDYVRLDRNEQLPQAGLS